MNAKIQLLAAALSAAALLPATAHAQAIGGTLYQKTNLVADAKGGGLTIDPVLLNPWGMVFQPDSAFWVADSNSGVATLYDGNGTKVQKAFTIPNPITASAKSQPTGLLWNPTPGFLVPGTQLTSLFMFATRQGSIAAWAPNLPTNPTVAVTAVDNSKTAAVYTALALGETIKGAFIYAANVHTAQIDVFDSTFKPANNQLTGAFADTQIPAGFTPFGIHNIEGNIVVTYAKQNATKTFITAGAGLGFVNIFDSNGNLLQRLGANGGEQRLFNAPWGVTLAPPSGFGDVGGDLLVGNYGDGHILAFDESGGVQALLNQSGQTIAAPGLLELKFGGGAVSDPSTLFMTVGVDGGAHGQLSTLTPVKTTLPPPASRD